MEFQAFRISEEGHNKGRIVSMHSDELSPGNVTIEVHYSSLNYKDALAITGQGKILRQFPLNAGIDVAGIVHSSSDPRFEKGEPVLVTGCGVGETSDGGYGGYVRVQGDWVVSLPSGLNLREAMIYGTAGFTAGLCVHRLLVNDQTPEKGPLIVTGASGGVGSLALAILSKLGFEVLAISGKEEAISRLRELGAREVLKPEALALGSRPLEGVRFGGGIDNVGGALLEGILRHVNLWGNVASVGLTGGHEFKSSVMPFILRGVSLLGISSTNCPMPLRREIWQKLAGAWRPALLESFVQSELGLEQLEAQATAMLQRRTSGRSLVKLRP